MADFNSVKENLIGFTLSSVVKSSHDLLVAVENAKDKTYPFWHVLVLLKWAYANCNDSAGLKEATIADIENTVTVINNFHDGIKLVDFKKGIKSELKKIAFQQFWFQDHIDEKVLFRAIVFFNHVKTKLDIDKEFKSASGLSIREFLNCTYLLYIYFHRDKIDKDVQFDGILYPEDLNAIFAIAGEETFMNFLKLIVFFPMTDPTSLQRMNFEGYQLYETTLWNRYPLLMVRGQVILIHRSPLKSMIRNFLYDYLKKNSVRFRTEVGERMEKYVEFGIIETNTRYLNEKQLEAKFTLQMVCDFLIEDDVLIECKAIELSPTAGIRRTKEVLQNEFDTNATKAYKQLLSVAHNLKTRIEFGIVITYKETLLGYGEDSFQEFMREPIKAFTELHKIDLSVLSPDRLVFITLEDWDRLISLKKHTGQRVSEILTKGFQYFRDGKVMLFEQILDKLCEGIQLPSLTYLERARPTFA
ncbi:MAG TPA: hypothetical protein VGD65_03950 [Chryseosolibacter sp.]